ncbi:MAG: hypothetical protein L0229_04160 [Blastocatellia bacterium]|nr:hypothetical protein [Blastocatellia bacterium]
MEGIISLMDEAMAAGITWAVEGSELVLNGPDSPLVESLALALLARKAEVLEVLALLAEDPEPPVYDFTPLKISGPMHCHADGCSGWIELEAGRGFCDRCGLAHCFVESLAPVERPLGQLVAI